jgi:integrase
LVRPPAGHEGRPSKALTIEQAQRLLRAAAEERPDGDLHPLHAYVVLLLTTGLRPEEARALRWDHVDPGFRQITRAAGLGDEWVPRELRHTFVSTSSAGGVPVEEIARLAGDQQTSTTGSSPHRQESVCRRKSGQRDAIRPITDEGVAVGGAFDSDTATGLMPIAHLVAGVRSFPWS